MITEKLVILLLLLAVFFTRANVVFLAHFDESIDGNFAPNEFDVMLTDIKIRDKKTLPIFPPILQYKGTRIQKLFIFDTGRPFLYVSEITLSHSE